MASHDRREFDKYLKFLTYKVTQVIVQSRQGRKIKTKSSPHGNEWFNITIQDDKQVSSELKHSLEGKLPQQDSPVCVEISMETLEGESLVLEVWCIAMNYSARDISVSVSHVFYPRLSLMLKSLIAISRTTPAYRLSRQQEDAIKFNYRVYVGSMENEHGGDFSHVHFAKSSCPYGTVSLSLRYRRTIVLPDRASRTSVHQDARGKQEVGISGSEDIACESLSQNKLPFTFLPHEPALKLKDQSPPVQPFSSFLPPLQTDESHFMSLTSSASRQDSGNSHNSQMGNPSTDDSDMTSLPSVPRESDGFIMVNIGEIRPSFAQDSGVDVCDFLQSGKEIPDLDLFSSEQSTDVIAAMRIIEDNTT